MQQNSASMGVTIQWLITDINGNQNVKVANQYFQQNYGSLQLPYTQSGLGRTNNYIEDLTIGFSRIG
jgi:integrin alpha FG-GAP repeat containing protein 1